MWNDILTQAKNDFRAAFTLSIGILTTFAALAAVCAVIFALGAVIYGVTRLFI